MIELTKQFITTTDEVGRLQRGNDPECRFFQEMANHGHFGGRPGSTRQGIYVCAPNGKFLASINSNDPERVMKMLQEGLAAWQALPESQRRLEADSQIQPRHRWEDSYPTDGLVLNVISRDLPERCDPSQPCEVKWNKDYVWFSQGEARQWLGEDPQIGDVHSLPEKLVARLVRFNLVDNVKGETPRFTPAGIEHSRISTEVVERNGPIVRVKIVGQTTGVAAEGWWQSANGVVTRVLGNGVFDLNENAFQTFEMVALGRRWGQTRFNGRYRDPDSGPLGYVFRLAAPDAPRIAPTGIASYEADWVIRPR